MTTQWSLVPEINTKSTTFFPGGIDDISEGSEDGGSSGSSSSKYAYCLQSFLFFFFFFLNTVHSICIVVTIAWILHIGCFACVIYLC